MISRFISFFRGLKLFSSPELVHYLGEKRFHLLKVNQVAADNPGSKIDKGIVISGVMPQHSIIIGKSSSICQGTVLAFGNDQGGFGRIIIGNNTWIGEYNNLRVTDKAEIVIGSNCLISQFCSIIGANHGIAKNELIQKQPQQKHRVGVKIENDVWLGAGVIVLPGLSIGRGAVVAANSVITKSVPSYEIWAGSPAEKISVRY